MCEAEDRLEEVESELDRLKEKIASADAGDFEEAAKVIKKEAWRTTDNQIKEKLLFLSECFELLGCEWDTPNRFEILAGKIQRGQTIH